MLLSVVPVLGLALAWFFQREWIGYAGFAALPVFYFLYQLPRQPREDRHPRPDPRGQRHSVVIGVCLMLAPAVFGAVAVYFDLRLDILERFVIVIPLMICLCAGGWMVATAVIRHLVWLRRQYF